MKLTTKFVPLNKLKSNLGINDGGKVQIFTDKTVSEALQPYVSFRDGIQEASIKSNTVLGSGRVIIGVPYATYQAYSKKIKKRVGKRGTQPFERMKADKKQVIFRQIENYAKKISN